MSETTVPAKNEQNELTPATREESRYLLPPVDIFESNDGLTVVADMPGVEKEGISVKVVNGILTMEGRPSAVHASEGNRLLNEFNLMNYYREFRIGETLEPDKISAELAQGVLTIHLPKEERAKPRQIKVNVG